MVRRSSVAALLSLVACTSGGSSSSSGGTGVVTQTEDQYCTARERRVKSCAGDATSSQTFDRTSCGQEYRCYSKLLAAPDTYFSCRTSADCSAKTGDDQCVSQSAAGRSVPESGACLRKVDECKAAGKSISDDNCGIMPALEPNTLASLAACMDKPCDQIKACVEALSASIPECK